jgi:S-adenosylmethionine hydrolase
MSRPVITLTTDFGQIDGYVGTMKGVMLSICPNAVLVDISHEIRPQAIRQAAFILHTAAPYFPPDTVHLLIVDPGVGTQRRPIAVQTARAVYVGPDNGALSFALALDPPLQAVHLTESQFRLPHVSATFHGRDVFAPAAAYLAHGTTLVEMGDRIEPSSLVTLPDLHPQPQPDGTWQGEILHIDHFGNLITNVQGIAPDSLLAVVIAGERIPGLSRTFTDVEPDKFVAYIGSSGHLEIAVSEGNAAKRLDVDIGDEVWVERPAITLPDDP